MASENERTADQASPRKRPTIASQNRVSKHTSAGRKIDQLCLPNKALVSKDFITDTPTNLSLETTPTSQEAGAGMQQTERQSTLAGHVEISPTMTADCSDTHTNDAQSWEHWDDIVAFAPGQDDSAVTTFIYNMLPKCKQWVIKRRKFPRKNPYDDADLCAYYIDLKSFVAYLDTIQVTPAIKNNKELAFFRRLITDPNNKGIMPGFIVNRFVSIWERWTEQIQDYIVDDGNEDDNSHIVGNSSQAGELPKISYPPRDHPIYGVGGIMYGVLAGKPSSGARFRYTIDPRLAKKNAQIVGHNGLVPGDWFPKQLVALFKGAHGASQGGIAGSKGQGAVSIIVGSAAYESVDKDCGNVIYYSGAQKLGARLPGDKSDSASTKLLLESFSKGNLVRVIRKKNHISQHAPAEGLRYDGLYRITTWVERFEITTGRHRVLLFTLVRDPGQLSLDDAKARAPSATEQRRIVEAVEKGY
ncbi:hypothetical protein MCOR27_008579 [Pyricularia oryzae]|uniref:YDG domain-containing protein n=1 Tax=Pyricularia grisea TaxID=148305 RepID=A0ABQ8NR04_PYRGI|nr:hypothetical protein MCOR01_009386 [Pyricularia oryzae]KAI6300716.1 hypothetical protein MCOR33_003632 [Pyricularia grisea]KAI6253942.1 hypothetical protein MCOR19_009537 [Pyricularia oryzae]KAI6271996.1 hypothetical protein MCOR27_008579 [Pyricularia oryzae]KAI6272174.1 hypothetical protein MCOR26_007474 [Pyricularia oryzae]